MRDESEDQNKYVYIVVNEGEVVFASKDEDEANNFSDTRDYQNRADALKEMGCDEDASESELAEAGFWAGYECGVNEVYCVNLAKYKEDDEICIGSDEISYNDIVSVLERCAEEDENQYFLMDDAEEEEDNE